MADVTYYVAMPFLQDESRLAGRGRRRRNARVRRRRCGALKSCRGPPAASAPSPSDAAAIP